MADFEISVTGDTELHDAIKRAEEALSGEQITGILLEGANILYESVKPNVPVGPTGRLKLSVTTKKMPVNQGYPSVALVAIDRKIAPHAHLVESGHRTVQGGSLRVSARQRKKGKGAGSITGRVPAHPFFNPNVNNALPSARAHIEARITDEVERAFNQ
jgi:hypothetical protein